MFIDTHAHLDRAEFNNNREQLLLDLQSHGIEKVVNPAILYESNFTMREKLEKYPWIYFAVGIHPARIKEWSHKEEERMISVLNRIAKLERCVGIGETGLDYYKGLYPEKQKEWFRKHIELAMEVERPLVLHVREAYEDALNILGEYDFKENAGVVHCFSGNLEIAKQCVDMGFSLGIGGKVTYKEAENIHLVVREIPLEYLVLETDAPFVKPQGCDGRVNTPLNLPIIANEIGKIKGISIDEVIKVTYDNAVRLFKL